MSQPIDTAYVEIQPDSSGFTRNLRRDVDRAFSDISKDVDRHTTKIRTAISGAFNAIGGALRAMAAITMMIVKMTALAAAAGAVSVALTGLASAVGGGIAALSGLVAVAVQAAGALLLIPGALAILASAIATLKIGFSGVGAAIKEAGAAAGGGSAQLEAAERRIELAQRNAKAAQEALTQARKDAQEQIEDLARSLNGARLDEEAAVIALEDAQRALVIAQRSGDPDAIRRADLAYRQAQQTLEDVRDRVGDLAEESEEANEKGVEGSDAVQAALQRQADAVYELDQAQKAATASAGGMASAMSKLAPNAQAFVRAIIALKPAFDALRMSVQNALFKDLGVEITKLANAQLPVLKEGLTEIAEEMNTGIIAAFRELSTEASKADFASIFRSAATVVHNLSGAVRPLLRALRDIVTVSAEAVAALTGGLDEWAEKFAKRIGDMRASGELRQIIDDGIEAVKQLLKLLGDVLGIIKGIGKAAGQSEGLFTFFDKLNKLINSKQGQSTLTALFEELGRLGEALMPVLLAVGKALVPVARGIADIAEAFAPTLAIVAEQLGDALAMLAPAFIAMAPAVAALGDSLAPLAEILADMFVAMGPGLAKGLDGLARGLEALIPAAEPVGRALGEMLALLGPILEITGAALAPALAAFSGALSALMVVATPILQVFADIAVELAERLLPPILELIKTALPKYIALGERLADAFEPLVPMFTDMAQIFADKLLEHIPKMIDLFDKLTPHLIKVVDLFAEFLIDILNEFGPRLPEIIDSLFEIWVVFADILLALAPLIPEILELGLLFARLAVHAEIVLFILEYVKTVLELLLGVINTIKSPMSTVIGIIKDAGKAFGILGGKAKDGMGVASKAVKDSVSAIKGHLSPLGGAGVSAGKAVAEGLIRGMKAKKSELEGIAAQMAAIVIGAATAALRLDSPSKVFMDIGKNTIEGYIVGLKKSTGDLRNTVSDIISGDVTSVAGQTNIDQSVNFGENSINMRLGGDVSRQTAMAAGIGAGRGIVSELARRRSVQVAVRTA